MLEIKFKQHLNKNKQQKQIKKIKEQEKLANYPNKYNFVIDKIKSCLNLRSCLNFIIKLILSFALFFSASLKRFLSYFDYSFFDNSPLLTSKE